MKMDYKVFEGAILACLKKELEESSGGSVTIEEVDPPGRKGVVFQYKDEAFRDKVCKTIENEDFRMRIRTVVWLDNVYAAHESISLGDIRTITLEIIGQLYGGIELENHATFVEDVKQMLDELPQSKEDILSKVEFIALNMEINQDVCSFAAYSTWKDLVLFYTIIVNDTPTYILKEHLNEFGITIEELHEAAVKNMASHYETVLMPVDEVLDLLRIEADIEDDFVMPKELKASMPYVCYMKDRPFSASAFLLPGVAKRCQELVGDTFYIVASSLHEVIIQPVQGSEPLMQETFVEMMNADLPAKDRLTNQVYFYNGNEFECVYKNPAPII